MHKGRLTDLTIKALQPPAKGNIVARDDLVTGFGVRVSQGGTKSFLVMYGRERQRHQIGRVGIVSLADARNAAKTFLAKHTLGKTAPRQTRFPHAMNRFLGSQDPLSP